MTKRNQTSLDMFVKSSKTNNSLQWKQEQNGSVLVCCVGGFKAKQKVAAFDFDHTIAGVAGTHVFPKSGSDWAWTSSLVPSVIKALHSLGFAIVVFSNQKGVLEDQRRLGCFQGRVQKTVSQLEGIPMAFLAATEDDCFRKPRLGLFWYFSHRLNEGLSINTCFYCGDAAGRSLGVTKKDHSDSDLKFSLNMGFPFLVPETLFTHPNLDAMLAGSWQPLESEVPSPPFDPRTFKSSESLSQIDALLRHLGSGDNAKRHVLLLVGAPGAGKSSFVRNHLPSLAYINQDTLKTRAKCLKTLIGLLNEASAKHVVVDNTNPDPSVRQEFIRAARSSADVVMHCVLFDVPADICKHNSAFREHCLQAADCIKKDVGDLRLDSKSATHISRIVYQRYYSVFKEPSSDEGFDHIHRIPFLLNFKSAAHETLWRSFYV